MEQQGGIGGGAVQENDLAETGQRVHARLLKELLQKRPNTRHSVGDAISVMELVDGRRMIAEETEYHFGRPGLLDGYSHRTS
jgi:hypothetical protein